MARVLWWMTLTTLPQPTFKITAYRLMKLATPVIRITRFTAVSMQK
ncbi:MAG TPA: hypothetical protein VN684_11570 [Terriglobales bacterium]|nr:hypothetical protein [Terriglobales bacterium]